MKTCIKCHLTKDFTEFYKKRDSVEHLCKACRLANSKRVYQANRENVLRRTSQYNKDNPEVGKRSRDKNKEKNRERGRKWYNKNKGRRLAKAKVWVESNKDWYKAWTREYYQRNKEQINTRIKAYKKANPEKLRIQDIKRRAVREQVGGSYSVEEWLSLCEYYGNRCLACGKVAKLTVDHVIPLTKGGPNSIDNLQPLCGSCNSKKHTTVIDYRNK